MAGKGSIVVRPSQDDRTGVFTGAEARSGSRHGAGGTEEVTRGTFVPEDSGEGDLMIDDFRLHYTVHDSVIYTSLIINCIICQGLKGVFVVVRTLSGPPLTARRTRQCGAGDAR